MHPNLPARPEQYSSSSTLQAPLHHPPSISSSPTKVHFPKPRPPLIFSKNPFPPRPQGAFVHPSPPSSSRIRPPVTPPTRKMSPMFQQSWIISLLPPRDSSKSVSTNKKGTTWYHHLLSSQKCQNAVASISIKCRISPSPPCLPARPGFRSRHANAFTRRLQRSPVPARVQSGKLPGGKAKGRGPGRAQGWVFPRSKRRPAEKGGRGCKD